MCWTQDSINNIVRSEQMKIWRPRSMWTIRNGKSTYGMHDNHAILWPTLGGLSWPYQRRNMKNMRHPRKYKERIIRSDILNTDTLHQLVTDIRLTIDDLNWPITMEHNEIQIENLWRRLTEPWIIKIEEKDNQLKYYLNILVNIIMCTNEFWISCDWRS